MFQIISGDFGEIVENFEKILGEMIFVDDDFKDFASFF